MPEKAEAKKEVKEGKKPTSQKKKCFLICPIGPPESETRKRSDKLLEYVLKPLLEGEYDIVRADHIPNPGMIPPQIVEEVLEDELVIADLTDRNPNVFYELAIRHVTQHPFIHLIEESQMDVLPFDNSVMRTIPYPGDFDVGKTKVCREEIRKAVGAAIDHPEKLNSPISIAQINKIAIDLKSSGKPQEEVLAQIFDMLKDVRANIQTTTSLPPHPLLAEAPGIAWTYAHGPRYQFEPSEFNYVKLVSNGEIGLSNAIDYAREMFYLLWKTERATDKQTRINELTAAIRKTQMLAVELSHLLRIPDSETDREALKDAQAQTTQIMTTLNRIWSERRALKGIEEITRVRADAEQLLKFLMDIKSFTIK